MDGDVEDLVDVPSKEETNHFSHVQLAKEGQEAARTQESPSTKDLAMLVGSLKRSHDSGFSYFYKEPPNDHIDKLQVALVSRPPRGWVEVKNKKDKNGQHENHND